MEQHHTFMQRALALARQVEGYTSPNPVVGAVVVRGGQIVGEGYHRRAGAPHAEVEALHAAGQRAHGATLYVTLEPCNHYGRTPPCTEALIKAGIAQVFYATSDPNPLVAGSGHRRLVEAGLAVHQGPCTAEAQLLNRFFFHYIRTKQPYTVAKFAASLDGKIATHTGHSQWITGDAARQKGHTLRHRVDAILIGANTAIADNPRLTTRLPQPEVRHPLRIVLDSRGRVPPTATLFQPDLPGQTIVATTEAMPLYHQTHLKQQGIKILTLPATPVGQVDIEALLIALGRRHVTSLMVEGGSETLGTFFERGYVNEVWAFIAPMIIGGQGAPGPVGGTGFAALAQACRLQSPTVETVGCDFLLRGFVQSTLTPTMQTIETLERS
ncbi:MAG: bifunctional diaminohydroxyphosphoribosylaminopyrimidine deaminase/5-amino-6-(5-phosphoribosylamino)uracil reductase RibD [Anaerolineae bacterium]|nr:bifunctional diaminohydroxyphosphoribosylaminopyrimidine deaminase/5-amino-6-(5-phosphoribosylamino)uracil reductase RibD [Anaerolineae bacterium]